MQALASIIGAIVSGETSEAVGRLRRSVIVYVLAGLLVLSGLGFLLVAGFIALARRIGAIDAALWFGGGFIALAILIVIGHRVVERIRARRIAKRRQSEMKAVAGAAALALLPPLLASRAGGLALLAPAVAALGWAVYRENAPRRGGPGRRV